MGRGQEQRREERKDLISHLEVRNRDSGEVIGHIGNVTTGGFALYSKRPIPFAPGDVMPVEIKLPWRIYGEDRI
ncbi:MAG: hypothetical protein N2255_07395, partial [Kiritimatiellae bacterium]|nr:hypothetical protein [Kiritimatiellia bacterium]